MSRIHANNFGTTINGSITNVATSIVLTSVTGFPSIGAGVTCNLTLQSGSNIEIVTATARSSNTITVTRGAEGTSGLAWDDGTSISIRPTADSVDRKLDATTTATSGKILQSDGSSFVASSATWPTAASTGKFVTGNGTNYVESTSTIPTSAGATANKHLKSDGTNYVLSTATISDSPGTSGKVLISDGTNWITSTPTFPNSASTSGKRLKSDGTNLVMTTTTMPDAGTSRKLIVGDGTNYVESTETWAVPGSSGNYLKSDGTNWTSAAFPFASQSDQETSTSNTVVVTPGVQQFHPSAAKWWAKVNGAGTSIVVSYNVTSITDGGTGILTVTIGTDFSSGDWVSLGQAYDNALSTHVQAISLAAGTVNYNAIATTTAALRDPSIAYLVAGFGDQ